MFCLLAPTKYKRQQIAILIISFFAYVAGIRNEGNNMLLQQQQQTTIENSNYQSDIGQSSILNFRPSPTINFTPADAVISQQLKPTYIGSTFNGTSNVTLYNNENDKQYMPQKQEIENDNRRYTIQMAETATATYGNVAKKQFSFPNEQQMLQHLTDKPIYIYRDPYTNEKYHYTATEATQATEATEAMIYNHNNYKQQHDSHHHHVHQNDDNQEYLVQSSLVVGSHPHEQQQPQQHQSQPNPFRPYMSLSDDKDVYLKRPGFVYDEKLSYNHPNLVINKKSEEIEISKTNKISYDSHDYPPPSYFQQQTSNFLPISVPATPKPVPLSHSSPSSLTPPFGQDYAPTPQPLIFNHQRPLSQQQQQKYLQSSQSSLPNYANKIDNYLLYKQPTVDYYPTEVQPFTYLQKRPQLQLKSETRPSSYEYDFRPPSYPPYQQQQQYVARPPSLSSSYPSSITGPQSHYLQYGSAHPPPGRPSYNNYYDYQIGEIPPQKQISIPPLQHFNYSYPRPIPLRYPYQGPYRPPLPPSQQQSGFATLAQLLGGIGGGGGSSSNNNSPLASFIGALTGTTTTSQQSLSPSSTSSFNRRPINSRLIKALENIARNDDLQCVPKVLCQMISSQIQRGQLPTFITSPTITNFLAGFPASSPALIYGRAALLGLSGGEMSCHQTYVKCPKNEYEIIYYLNNHRGGFFKFFSEPDEQYQTVNHESTQQGSTSLFSVLAGLAGMPQATTTTLRPKPKPQAPSTDITSGIEKFFTQLLSGYMGGATVEYQRRLKRNAKISWDDKIKFEVENAKQMPTRDVIKFGKGDQEEDELKFKDKERQNKSHREGMKFLDEDHNDYTDINLDNEDFHDDEDDEDTQQVLEFKDEEQDNLDDTKSRILHKTGERDKRIKFFPEIRENLNENDKEQELKNIIKKFNDFNKRRKLKFPSITEEREHVKISEDERQGKFLSDDLLHQEQNYGHQYTNYVENSYENFQRETKKIKFVDDASEEVDNPEQDSLLYLYYSQKPKDYKSKLVFPKREGKILNRPYYAASYLQDYFQPQQQQQQHQLKDDETTQGDKFIIPNNQKALRYTEYPYAYLGKIYNTYINTLQPQSSFISNAAVNNNIYVSSSSSIMESNSNHFLPTPSPLDDIDYTAFNSIYTNSDYNQQHNYNSFKQGASQKPQKYPSSSVTSALNGADNNFYKPQRYPANSYMNYNQYHTPSSVSSHTTRRPYANQTTTKSDDKNIYVTNSKGVTEYYITPDGRKVYL